MYAHPRCFLHTHVCTNTCEQRDKLRVEHVQVLRWVSSMTRSSWVGADSRDAFLYSGQRLCQVMREVSPGSIPEPPSTGVDDMQVRVVT